MEDKVKIILRHIALANEYTRLANSPQELSPEEWGSINKRMDEIMQEIEALRDTESTWDLTDPD